MDHTTWLSSMDKSAWLSGLGVCLGAAGLLQLVQIVQSSGSGSRRNPPGPRGKWLVGNLFDIPASFPWLRFSEWGKIYGAITYTTVLGQPVVILNALDAGKKLMARAAGRPFCIMHDLMGMSQDMSVAQDTPMWRYERKLTQTALGPQAVKAFCGIQKFYAAVFLKRMFEGVSEDGKAHRDCEEELRDALGKSIFTAAYGLPTQGHFDEFIRLNSIVSAAFLSAQVPGKYLVESFPILRYVPSWFPGAGFKRHAQHVSTIYEGYASAFFSAAKAEIATGMAPPSFVSNCLEAQAAGELRSASEVDEQLALKYVASEMYRAAIHTTVHTIVKFIAAMQIHPEVQRKAQEEIARVVGADRLPSPEDRASLPYVNAVITESHRWHSALAIGLPHRVTKDEEYKGYFIAKDTNVICNLWNLSLLAEDGSPLDRPDEFIPERYLPDAPAAMRPPEPREYVFGFGRRICPGRHMAENILFLTISSVLATAWISSPVGDDGKEESLTFTWTGENAFSYPEPFHPVLKPRSAKAVELINAACEAGYTRDAEAK